MIIDPTIRIYGVLNGRNEKFPVLRHQEPLLPLTTHDVFDLIYFGYVDLRRWHFEHRLEFPKLFPDVVLVKVYDNGVLVLLDILDAAAVQCHLPRIVMLKVTHLARI